MSNQLTITDPYISLNIASAYAKLIIMIHPYLQDILPPLRTTMRRSAIAFPNRS